MYSMISHNGGRLISKGNGRHNVRKITDYELIFVISNQLEIFVDDCNFQLKPGDALLIPPKIMHGGLAQYRNNLSFFWIHFAPENQEAQKKLAAQPYYFKILNPKLLSEYFQLFLTLQSEYSQDSIAMNQVCSLILHEACKNQIQSAAAQEINIKLPHILLEAEKELILNFREELSTALLAKRLHCNPDYLGRLFRQYRNTSIIQELHRQRLKHAENLLISSNMSISEIAYEVGYSDLGYFRKWFHRNFAMSPGEYRNFRSVTHINSE